MWCYRSLLHISYKDLITNNEVLTLVDEKRWLLDEMKRKKLVYFGHLIRADGKQKHLIEGEIEVTRRRGRQRRKWSNDIMDWMEMSYERCGTVAKNRKDFRVAVVDLLARR